jgi:hypothetical protein
LNYTGDDVEEVFCLNFTIAETYFGDVIHKPLKPDGENTPVTKENKEEFVKLYVDYVLNKSCEASFDAFKKGFLRVMNTQVLQLFHAKVSTIGSCFHIEIRCPCHLKYRNMGSSEFNGRSELPSFTVPVTGNLQITVLISKYPGLIWKGFLHYGID